MGKRRPNILLMTSDQQHFGTLGVTNERIQTPALDRLCREGVRFNRAYCVNPVCSPSRSTMITGLYPAWHHCWTIGVKLPMMVRWPGRVEEGGVSSALQSQVDFAPTFLDAAGIRAPGIMQGVGQLGVWCGEKDAARDHVIVENRHEPTRVHLRTFIDERYKLTVYRHTDYGEFFDLEQDPGETCNLWDDPEAVETKMRVMHRFLQAELQREPTRMPRIAGA
ncbi:MAG TPA: hypothetical protein ENN80_08995 [Candidatus Hydrogenedentes bacterium]|nr:hypothetical protein [Candidatus Hydrogenedentota bacterium]